MKISFIFLFLSIAINSIITMEKNPVDKIPTVTEPSLSIPLEAPEIKEATGSDTKGWNNWFSNLPIISPIYKASEGIKKIGEASEKISDHGLKADADQKVIDSFDKATASINKASESINHVSNSFNKINENGLKISSLTIKSLFTSGIGLALAIAGIALIYKELSKEPALIQPTPQKPLTPLQKTMQILKNRAVIGLGSIAAGLLLVIHSDKISQSI